MIAGNLQNKKAQSAHVASTNEAPEKSITTSANDYAKFTQYQESLKSQSTPIIVAFESGKSNTCMVSSSSKWVIDSGATNHMIRSYNEEEY